MHYLWKTNRRDLDNKVVEDMDFLHLQASVKSKIWDWIMDDED